MAKFPNWANTWQWPPHYLSSFRCQAVREKLETVWPARQGSQPPGALGPLKQTTNNYTLYLKSGTYHFTGKKNILKKIEEPFREFTNVADEVRNSYKKENEQGHTQKTTLPCTVLPQFWVRWFQHCYNQSSCLGSPCHSAQSPSQLPEIFKVQIWSQDFPA